MGTARSRIWDSEGNGFTTVDISAIFKKSNSIICEIIREEKVKYLKTFVEIFNKRALNRRDPLIITDKEGNKFNMIQIGVMLNRSRSWVTKARTNNDCVIFEDFVKYKNRTLSKNAIKYSARKTTQKFNRKVCFRNNFEIECKHYSSCCDSRLMGEHHARVKANGSCFTSARHQTLINVSERPIGSWEIDNVRCPDASTETPQEFWKTIRQVEDGNFESTRDYRDERWYIEKCLKRMKGAQENAGREEGVR